MAIYFCPGRWQPLHAGHKALIDKLLNEGHDVVIGIRDTLVNPENPYTVSERRRMIRAAYGDRVEITVIPDFDVIAYGRKVGWGLREIRLDEQIEAISGTEIRAKVKQENQHDNRCT